MSDDGHGSSLDGWFDVDEVGEGLDEDMARRAIRWSIAGVDLAWDSEDRPEWELALGADETPDIARNPLIGDPTRCGDCDLDRSARWSSSGWDCCCRRCHSSPLIDGYWPLCAACQVEILCRVCGLPPKLVKGRCDACRKYFARHGVERPRWLIMRSRNRPLTLAELDETIRQTRLAGSSHFR